MLLYVYGSKMVFQIKLPKVFSASYFLIPDSGVQGGYTKLMANRKRLWEHRALIIRMAVGLGLFLVLYAVLPQLAFFDGARESLHGLQPPWLLVAAATFSGTYLMAALMFACLGRRRIPLGRTVVVQMAAAFASRLLPAGSGAAAVSYSYLRQRKYDAPESAGIVAMNNLLGFVGNMCLIALAFVVDPDVVGHLRFPHIGWGAGVAVVGLGIGALCFWHWRRRTLRFLRAALSDLMGYKDRPAAVVLALLVSVALTLLYMVTFFCCVRAAGLQLTFTASLVIFSFGVLVGALTPSPGGIGGVEAALTAGLTSFGVTPGTALAVALSYRLITFWLALIIGSFAFVIALRLHFFTPYVKQ